MTNKNAHPILLDSTIPQSPVVLKAIEGYQDSLRNFTRKLGNTKDNFSSHEQFK